MKSTRKKPLGHPVILSRVTQYFAVTFHQTRSQQPFKTRKANIPATLCSVILTWLETKLISYHHNHHAVLCESHFILPQRHCKGCAMEVVWNVRSQCMTYNQTRWSQ